jgi:biotin synthase
MMIGVSAGTAAVLGLRKTRCDELPVTAYFMLGGQCKGHCQFCARSGDHSSPPRTLSRVSWPLFDEDEVFSSLAVAYERDELKRACVQMVNSEESSLRIGGIVRKIRMRSSIPLSLSSNSLDLFTLEHLFQSGLTTLSIPIDCATSALYASIKGGSMEVILEALTRAAMRYPGRVATHLIAGLGESEEEMLKMLEYLYDHGITAGLFAFTPLPGTALSGRKPPELAHYRRVQLAHYCIRENMRLNYRTCRGTITFSDHMVDTIREELRGEPFRTSGCPGCNRPYYNERPGRIPYNYPRKLFHDEIADAYRLALGHELQSSIS